MRDTKESRYPNERTPIEPAERNLVEGVMHDIAEQKSPPKDLFEERNDDHQPDHAQCRVDPKGSAIAKEPGIVPVISRGIAKQPLRGDPDSEDDNTGQERKS